MKISQLSFVNKCRDEKISFIPELYEKHKNIGKIAMLLCGDMEFNLSPNSLAYRDKDKNYEAAVFCAEALARIPQQKVKWGAKTTKYFAPNLYKSYFGEVIKEEEKYYKNTTGKNFQLTLPTNKKSFVKSLFSN